MDDQNLAAEYLALKAANDQLRERGKQWMWKMLDLISGEISREMGETPLQVGRQNWEFQVESATMVGERYGARCRSKTMTFEIGWPRLPEHGFISGGGLACGRISLSQNTMLTAHPITELMLKRNGNSDDIAWHLMTNKQAGDRLDEARLRLYLQLLLTD